MTNIQLDYSDIADIFKEKLKVDNIVKKISSVFQNIRYSSKIDYKPYFQRNYVWDDEKATYFIESILLGTEIPPLVLFQTKTMNEVIDGRQRYETIQRFLNDKLVLNENGLHSLKLLSGKKFSQLTESIKEQFEDTRIRILQFSVVDEPRLDDEKEDKIKKEIFRRYNSGITPLQKEEIERAAYISDKVSNAFFELIYRDNSLFDFLCQIVLPKSKTQVSKRDKVNILVTRIRTLITLPYIPIYSYAHGSSKSDIIRRYFYLKIAKNDCVGEINKFVKVIDVLKLFYKQCYKANIFLRNNKLFYEVLYWAISILQENNVKVTEQDTTKATSIIMQADQYSELWKHIINDPQKSVEFIFDQTGSHYYSAINNRYNFVANIFNFIFNIDFSNYMKDSDSYKKAMDQNIENNELMRYQLNKPLPETLTIEDIASDMNKSRFLVRPNYQRSEVTNLQKASYLMESILLGINIPPIFIYKRPDKVKEVVDGQQRILTILGFLGKKYKNERGEIVSTRKDKFKLSKLKILTELNGQTIETINPKFEDKILEFPMDVIEIDSSQNSEFSPIDLFLRLNTKPYPIRENTFEMWNAYIDKEITAKVKELASIYAGKIFRAHDNRMKVEELITSLAYLDYRMSQPNTEIIHILTIYKRNNKMCSRIMSKDSVTKVLSDLSCSNSAPFLVSIDNIQKYIEKINILIDNDPPVLRKLFSHSKRGMQFRTDQNFYFLWTMLRNIPKEKLIKYKGLYFKKVSNLFSLIQMAPNDYTVEHFLHDINSFN